MIGNLWGYCRRRGKGGESGKRRVLHTNNIDDISILLYIVREKVVVKKYSI